ncbi:MAG: HD domain-containing protein [Candidatus Omnitrophica bacterium]|nr:HD domain-containing protein [Candidatus Omnitrophota bacterium]MBU1925571.1 HD domain-containing protein [Candidatus Omnitrophota bacterium]
MADESKSKEELISELNHLRGQLGELDDTYRDLEKQMRDQTEELSKINDAMATEVIKRKKLQEEFRLGCEKLQRVLNETISALSYAVEKRDPYTAGHQARVTKLAGAIAEHMNLSEQVIMGVKTAATVHDIGKINIPAEILSKPSELTKIEYSMITVHPQIGYEILKNIEFPWPVSTIVLQHHERLNGSGYPQGLQDDQIILEARILIVADVVEAMASHRPYRPALGINMALEEIEKKRGILYDPAVADACIHIFRTGKFSFEQ